MSDTLFFEPGGLTLGEIEIAGATTSPDGVGGSNIIYPTFFAATIFYNVLAYGGGLSDLFCAKPVPDTGSVPALVEQFVVPAGKVTC